MKVKDLMVEEVITLHINDEFHKIIAVLTINNISGAPVVNKRGKIMGIISDKDIFSHLFPDEQEFYANMEYWVTPGRLEKEASNIKGLKAKHIMTKEVISVSPDDSIMHACALVLINKVRRLPVVDNGKIIGIVSTRTLYNSFINKIAK